MNSKTVPAEATDAWALAWCQARKMSSSHVAFAHKVINDVLSTAPTPEPDADRVERVARALWRYDCATTDGSQVAWEQETESTKILYLALARAAIAAMGGGDVGVRPLEWDEMLEPAGHQYPGGDLTGWEASTLIGSYLIEIGLDGFEAGYNGLETCDIGEFDSPDEAKTACQNDYEARIRSALHGDGHE